ncbi:DNA primase regulatory subunit PriL [Halobacteriales archaeon QS_9_68_17]|nr:MAG: DNA primase regulatory subunit PriL [Halobacteriales archaeon QS_9_68_17]
MKRFHARYPFLDAAREAVDAAAVDLADLVAREDAVERDSTSPRSNAREDPVAVDRAVGRVEAALSGDTTGDPHRRPRVELLSYPIARVLVSLVGDPVLTRKYARAEAVTAHRRFTSDFAGDQLRSASGERMTLDRLLREFDLDGTVAETDDGYRVAVGDYLQLSGDLPGDRWRLATRALADGAVPVDREELHLLLRQAVEERVGAGLPLSVPDAIANDLDAAVETVEDLLADLELSGDIDTVAPDLFPPCMANLVERSREGAALPEHSRFVLTSFLTAIGMDDEEIAAFCGAGDEYRTDRIATADGGTEYPPPSCETMVAYGDCVNTDEVCETVPHPLKYYEKRLDAAEATPDARD